MRRTLIDAVRELCLSLPEVEEKQSHGMDTYRVDGKSFANFAINHHGDGHVALWLEAKPGAQTLYTEMEPEHYFIPPFVGPRGWLGLELNQGIEWASVVQRVKEAYEKVASAARYQLLDDSIVIAPPDDALHPEEIDSLLAQRPQEILNKLAGICLALPETQQTRQFGTPVWKAGKKSFACVHRYDQRLSLQIWVGHELQSFLVADKRYLIPAYVGHNGWIDLDIEEEADWAEIENLLMTSYRHFALKRMLKQLEEG